MAGCNACTKPDCQAPELLVAVAAVSVGKCGATNNYSDPPKFYRTMIDTTTLVGGGATGSRVITTNYDDDCVPTVECTGSVSSGSESCNPCEGTIGPCENINHFCNVGEGDFPTSDTTSQCEEEGALLRTWELSDEVTTDDMKEHALATLPDFSDYAVGAVESITSLSEDESSFTIQRAKWYLRHPPTATCYFHVWLQKTFRPEGTSGESDEISKLEYVWTGSGTPCFAAPDKGVFEPENLIEKEKEDLAEPTENGTTTITILKWSCLADYTPDDPDPDDPDADIEKPNGFPK